MTQRRGNRRDSKLTRVAQEAMSIIGKIGDTTATGLIKGIEQAKKNVHKDVKKVERKVQYLQQGEKIVVQGGQGNITRCMKKLGKYSSTLKVIELAMSKEFDRTIREGEKAATDNKFSQIKAVHFTSNAKLTEVCDAQRGFSKKYDKHNGLIFEVGMIDIQNKKKIEDGYEQADVNHGYNFLTNQAYGAFKDKAVHDDLLFAPRNFSETFQFRSMILSDDETVENLTSNLQEFGKSLSIQEGITKRISESIARINNQDYKKDVFIFNTGQDIRKFYTKHYEVSFCQINAHSTFREGTEEYKVVVHRSMIYASLNEKTTKTVDNTYNIPLCEEMVIHISKKMNNEFFLLPKSCLVHAKLKLSQSNAPQWHYLENNAFTVSLPPDVCIRADPHKRAMFMTGFLTRKVMDVSHGSADISDRAVGFFKDLFKNTVSIDKDTADLTIKAANGITSTRILKNITDMHMSRYENKPMTDTQKVEMNKLKTDDKKKEFEQSFIEDQRNAEITSFQAPITDNDLLRKSFLNSKYAHKLTYVKGDDSFFTKQCFASFSFCITVLSPFENQAINAVFVGAYGATAEKLKSESTTVVVPVDYTRKTPTPPASSVVSVPVGIATATQRSTRPVESTQTAGRSDENEDNDTAPPRSFTKAGSYHGIPSQPSKLVRQQSVHVNPGRAARSEFHQPYRHTARDVIASRFPRPFHNSTLPPELELELELL